MAAERIQKRLEEAIQSGNYYEAHQTLRTLYNRQFSAKKYDVCRQILIDGCRQFNKIGEIACVADLAESYATTLEAENLSNDAANFLEIAEILAMLPPSSERIQDSEMSPRVLNTTTPINRDKVVAQLVKWSKKATNDPKAKNADPRLNLILAKQYWKDGQMETAKYYFARSKDGLEAGKFGVDYQQRGGADAEHVIAQIALQMMALKQPVAAVEAIKSYCANHALFQYSPPRTDGAYPMVNYVYFLAELALRKESLPAYVCLGEKYSQYLEKLPPKILSYIDKVGQIYFGLPPPQTQSSNGGMFGNLLKGLANMDQDIDDDDQLMEDAVEVIEPRRQMMQNDELD